MYSIISFQEKKYNKKSRDFKGKKKNFEEKHAKKDNTEFKEPQNKAENTKMEHKKLKMLKRNILKKKKETKKLPTMKVTAQNVFIVMNLTKTNDGLDVGPVHVRSMNSWACNGKIHLKLVTNNLMLIQLSEVRLLASSYTLYFIILVCVRFFY